MEYVPAPQLVQVPPTDCASAVEKVPAAQLVHAEKPVPVLYLPIAHKLHAVIPVVSEPKLPAAQEGHTHVKAEHPVVVDLKVPAVAQMLTTVHAAAPVAVL